MRYAPLLRLILSATLPVCAPLDAHGQAATPEARRAHADTLTVTQRMAAIGEDVRRARAGKNYEAELASLEQLLALSPSFPSAMLRAAGAQARLGHAEAALAWLNHYANAKLSKDVATDSDITSLPSLANSAAFKSVANRIARNATAVSRSDTAFVLPEPDLIAEDIAYDHRRHQFYVSSVRKRKIIAVDSTGHARDFTHEGQDGTWSIFALALDPSRDILWATTAASPMAPGNVAADTGKSALLQYDLATGRLLHRFEPPDHRPIHALGDMAIAPNGDVYVSDGQAGMLYRLRHGAHALETVVGPTSLASPQSPTVTPDGRQVFVADYVRGIAVLDVATGSVSWLGHAPGIVATGIDGLYFINNALVAIQNGTSPERVIRFTLNPSFSRITGFEVLESNSAGLGDPTHGVVVGPRFFYIANSGWDYFDDDGSPKKAVHATPPAIRTVRP